MRDTTAPEPLQHRADPAGAQACAPAGCGGGQDDDFELEILLEEADPVIPPGELYALYQGYARGLAHKLAHRRRVDDFARGELVDAALQGLLDAAQLWQERPHAAKFTTYAYWHVKGGMIDRLAELARGVSVDPDWAFAGERPAELRRQSRELGAARLDEQVARAMWPYVEQALAEVARRNRVTEIVRRLRSAGALSPLQDQIVDPLFLEGRDILEVADELDLNLARLRVAATKLMQRLRAGLRDDSLFPDALFRLPVDHLPAARSEALTIAREALGYLRPADGGAPDLGRARPLESFGAFLPDIDALAASVDVPEQHADRRSPTARVVSFYRHALGLRSADLAAELSMKRPAVDKMLLVLNLDHRQSAERIRTVANALSIDPEQILFSAQPELRAVFDRVVYAGDDVYLAPVSAALPPAELAQHLAEPPRAGRAHGFGSVIGAYRLAAGEASASNMGRYYKGFEAGAHTSLQGSLAMAERIGMPPLLAVLGTRPELRALFDVVDESGALLLGSERDYGRLVIVLGQPRPAAAAAASQPLREPDRPGLAPFFRYLLARLGPVLTRERLEAAGASYQLVGNALAGRPPHRPANVQALARALQLNPFSEARLCCEALRARLGGAHEDLLLELIAMAREQSCSLELVDNARWASLSGLMTADPEATARLTQEFYGRSRRGFRAYLSGLKALWHGEVPPEERLLGLILHHDEARGALVRLRAQGVLSLDEERLAGAVEQQEAEELRRRLLAGRAGLRRVLPGLVRKLHLHSGLNGPLARPLLQLHAI